MNKFPFFRKKKEIENKNKNVYSIFSTLLVCFAFLQKGSGQRQYAAADMILLNMLLV
jgi:hypothetical protein